jgi:hypothetical protein
MDVFKPRETISGNGALYKFREFISLGKEVEKVRLNKLKKLGYSFKCYPKEVQEVSIKDHNYIVLALANGLASSKVCVSEDLGTFKGKTVCLGQFDDPNFKDFTLWRIEDITFLKISTFKYVTCSFIGGLELDSINSSLR